MDGAFSLYAPILSVTCAIVSAKVIAISDPARAPSDPYAVYVWMAGHGLPVCGKFGAFQLRPKKPVSGRGFDWSHAIENAKAMAESENLALVYVYRTA